MPWMTIRRSGAVTAMAWCTLEGFKQCLFVDVEIGFDEVAVLKVSLIFRSVVSCGAD
jgi:hypothetical protein